MINLGNITSEENAQQLSESTKNLFQLQDLHLQLKPKLPTVAKKIFSGVIFDVYQWQEKLYDGSHSTFEMLKRVNTSEVLIVSDGQIMISKQEQPGKKEFYSFAGGRGEVGETPLDTAKRELLEETGLVADNWELFCATSPISKIDWAIYTYIVRDPKVVSEPKLDAGEKLTTLKLSFAEFSQLVLAGEIDFPELRIALLEVRHNPQLFEQLKRRILQGVTV